MDISHKPNNVKSCFYFYLFCYLFITQTHQWNNDHDNFTNRERTTYTYMEGTHQM
jgi:hypothetical protein